MKSGFYPFVFSVGLLINFAYVITVSTAFAEQELDSMRFSVGAFVSSGDYNFEDKTLINAIPLSFEYRRSHWRFKNLVSLLNIDGPGTVTLEGGGLRLGDQHNDETGVGDWFISVAYDGFYNVQKARFWELQSKLKVPIADEDKGLGTGTFDFSVSYSLMHVFSNSAVWHQLGYRFRENSSQLQLNDTFNVSVGGQFQGFESFALGYVFNYKQAQIEGNEAARESFLYLNRRLDTQHVDVRKLSFYLLFGHSKASPDYALGVQAQTDWLPTSTLFGVEVR